MLNDNQYLRITGDAEQITFHLIENPIIKTADETGLENNKWYYGAETINAERRTNGLTIEKLYFPALQLRLVIDDLQEMIDNEKAGIQPGQILPLSERTDAEPSEKVWNYLCMYCGFEWNELRETRLKKTSFRVRACKRCSVSGSARKNAPVKFGAPERAGIDNLNLQKYAIYTIKNIKQWQHGCDVELNEVSGKYNIMIFTPPDYCTLAEIEIMTEKANEATKNWIEKPRQFLLVLEKPPPLVASGINSLFVPGCSFVAVFKLRIWRTNPNDYLTDNFKYVFEYIQKS